MKRLALSSCVNFGPSFKHYVYHTHFIGVLVCYFLVCFVLVNLLLGDKQEAKFEGVVSVQNTHYILIF